MITKQQICEIGGCPSYANDYEYHWNSWDYLYNSKTNTFWFINDGFGEPDLIVDRVKDYEHLKEIVTSLNLDI